MTEPHILIIEDDPTVSTLLVEVLHQEGFTATVASDGLEGLVKLQTGAPDLALLDIMMPDVDGTRVIQQLLEEGDGALRVPIIVVTGSGEGAEASRRLLGADNVFEKPFDPGDLVDRVRAVLGQPAP